MLKNFKFSSVRNRRKNGQLQEKQKKKKPLWFQYPLVKILITDL